MKITILGHPMCGFCHAARDLATAKKFDFEWIDISQNPEKFEKAKAETGHPTVPIIFVDGVFVGGFTEFEQKVENGEIA